MSDQENTRIFQGATNRGGASAVQPAVAISAQSLLQSIRAMAVELGTNHHADVSTPTTRYPDWPDIDLINVVSSYTTETEM